MSSTAAAPGAAGAATALAEAVARRSYGKLVAMLAARTRDVAAAEDALADAFAAALTHWPASSVPATPEAWLLTAARHRLIDAARQRQTQAAAADTLQLLAEWAQAANGGPGGGERREIPDDRLALMFACAHPAIDAPLRAPLMLQTLLGFDAVAIGSAFLVAPTTMGQRLVRAKARIRRAGIPFAVPPLDQLGERLDAVLDALYACYAEGWADAAGTDSHRRNLADEAVWLAGLLASLLPDEPEALGLLALMLHTQARQGARRDAAGRYVPLDQQDPRQWDAGLQAQAERLLHRASALALGGRAPAPTAAATGPTGLHRIGRFQLEAAIQSAHSMRRFNGSADWPAILILYDGLLAITQSPVVRLNRALALAETQGPQAALAEVEALAAGGRLAGYQPMWAAQADLLGRLGRATEADSAYARAIGLAQDAAVRDFLQARRRQATGQAQAR